LKAAHKVECKEALAEKIRQEPMPLPEGPFRVIVIDPPWRYESRAEDATHRSRNPYPDMSMEKILALPVPAHLAADAIVWLWTTNSFMHEAFHCLDHWGVEQKTILTWRKNQMGTGDWLRGRTEHCLLAVRGKPLVTLTNQTTDLVADRSRHSAKPDAFYELVESLCPARNSKCLPAAGGRVGPPGDARSMLRDREQVRRARGCLAR
jgi:N6-adenosine-specific RNA methylase IME4